MSNILTHHGVLGMKWGVRRTPEQLNRRQGKRDAKQITKLNKSIRIKSDKKKKVLEKQIKERMSNAVYRKAFNATLKDIDALAERKQWAKEYNRGIANAIAKTASTTTVRAITGQYGKDVYAEMLTPTVYKMQSDALVKSVFGR